MFLILCLWRFFNGYFICFESLKFHIIGAGERCYLYQLLSQIQISVMIDPCFSNYTCFTHFTIELALMKLLEGIKISCFVTALLPMKDSHPTCTPPLITAPVAIWQ